MIHSFHRASWLFSLVLWVGFTHFASPAFAEAIKIESNSVPLEIDVGLNPARVKIKVNGIQGSLRQFHQLNAVIAEISHSNFVGIPASFSNLLFESVRVNSNLTLLHANEHLFAVSSEGRWFEVAKIDEKILAWGVYRLDVGAKAEVIFVETEVDRRNSEVQIFVLPYKDEELVGDVLSSGAMPLDGDLNFYVDGRNVGWRTDKHGVEYILEIPSKRSGSLREFDPTMRGSNLPQIRRVTETVVTVKGRAPQLVLGPNKSSHLPSPDKDLFEDEDYIHRISSFESEYNKQVIGQTKVAARLSQALFAHAGNPLLRSKPFSVILVGPKRTGKTMTGKAMAKILYGSEKKSITIALGSVKNESELRNVVGSPKSYMGSDKPGQLELAIEKLFDQDDVARGVIVLDEFSDMGGGRADSSAMKGSLLKSFYELIHEGRFYSSVHSKYLDVSEVAFILTGNDGAILFEGVPGEKAKQIRHDENSDRIKVEKMLEATGVPGPLLKRVDDVILVEPMSREKARRIVLETLLPEFKKAFLDEYTVKIEFGPSEAEFVKTLVTDYFASDDGVAGIKDLVYLRIGSLVSRGLIDNRKELNGALRRTVRVQWTSVTELEVKVLTPHQSYTYHEDLSAYRSPRPLLESDSDDPFDDPRLAERIGSLTAELQKRVFGQDEILDSLVEMIRAKVYDPAKGVKRPQAAFLVGTTGSGKTETAKALAQSLYGSESEKHLEILPMGEYHDKAEFNKFLGAAPGYVGSERESDFEVALRKLLSSGGGILVLDELSNVGGGDASLKNQLCKILYNIKEEGKWTSPRTGITYDLSSIFILMTGNDAEEFFQGAFAYSDQMRQSIWEEHSKREALEEGLIKKGFSSAFLGRLDGVFLQRPQGLKALEQIVQRKFLGPALSHYREAHPGLEFTWDEKFIRHFTETFFAHGRGARSLRTVIDQYLKGLVTHAILFSREKGFQKGSALTIHLTLNDNWEGLVFREETTPEERVVFLNALLKWSTGSQLFSRNVSSVTPEKPLFSRIDSDATAYHEAGHAVANLSKWTGERVKYITIRGGGQIMGYASYKRVPGSAAQDRNSVVGKLASLMAGQLGEMMAGHPKQAGWSTDLMQIRALVRKAMIVWGLVPELVGVQVDADDKPMLSPHLAAVYRREMKRLLRDAFQLAQTRLQQNWAQMEQVRDLLMNEGVVTEKMFHEIMSTSSDVTGRRMTPRKEPLEIPMESLFGKSKKIEKNGCIGFLVNGESSDVE